MTRFQSFIRQASGRKDSAQDRQYANNAGTINGQYALNIALTLVGSTSQYLKKNNALKLNNIIDR